MLDAADQEDRDWLVEQAMASPSALVMVKVLVETTYLEAERAVDPLWAAHIRRKMNSLCEKYKNRTGRELIRAE